MGIHDRGRDDEAQLIVRHARGCLTLVASFTNGACCGACHAISCIGTRTSSLARTKHLGATSSWHRCCARAG